MLFDTTFLIDYEREMKRNRPGAVHWFQHFQRVRGLKVISY
jgi:hypothetical protein